MKDLNNQSRLATFLLITLGCCMAAPAQITPSGDAYTNTATRPPIWAPSLCSTPLPANVNWRFCRR
jgi:hypothetical protein